MTPLGMLLQAAQQAPEAFNTDVASYGMTPSTPADVVGAWIVCFLTLSVFSFLYRDNPFYKIAEHLFVGVGTAWFTLEYYEQGVLEPIVEYMHAAASLGPGEEMTLARYPIEPAVAIALRCVPLLLSFMLLTRLFSRDSWLPRWPLAVMVGIYSALKMTGETQSKLVLQIKETFVPLVNPDLVPFGDFDAWTNIEQTQAFYTFGRLVFLVGLLCALGHFIFTFRPRAGLRAVSRAGVVTLMITFGSMFGFTVLGRIALLIERISDLERFTVARYGLGAPPEDTALAVLLSPPLLIGATIVVLLTLGALRRRGEG